MIRAILTSGSMRSLWQKPDRSCATKPGHISCHRQDAFLHLSALKSAGYVSVPAGTSMQVRVEEDRGGLPVVEALRADTRTALAGEPAPVRTKRPTGAQPARLTPSRATEWGRRVGPRGIKVEAHAMVANRRPPAPIERSL